MLKFGSIVVSTLLALAAPAVAQSDYPTKPIRIVLPFPPGGGTDAIARLIGEGMSKRLGQQVLIDNRPGAGGNIASDVVAKVAPDGYTLLMGFSTALTVTPSVSPNLTFNVQRDFVPITQLASGQYVLVVNPQVGAKSLAELIAYGKQRPGDLNFGSSGNGSPHHLAGELLMARTGARFTHLAYKGASGSTTAILGNEIQLVFGSVPATLPHIKVDKMRPLATSGLKRHPSLPDVPTLNESGLPGFDVSTWYGLLAPTGTPQAVIDKLHDTAVAVLKEPKSVETLERLGLEAIGNTGPEFGKIIVSETASWAKVIKEAGIKFE
jgi:tripartite-type tricarboxylate transporter receptor subunit TctC